MKSIVLRFFITSRSILRMRIVSDIFVEKIKTLFFYFLDKRRGNKNTNVIFLTILENHAVCEILWKNIVQPGRPQMKIWLMSIA